MKRTAISRLLVLAATGAACTGCISVKAPEHINIQRHAAVENPDNLPPTASHREARQRLAEAYAEIRYLRGKVQKLENDKDELKRERDDYKHRCDD